MELSLYDYTKDSFPFLSLKLLNFIKLNFFIPQGKSEAPKASIFD